MKLSSYFNSTAILKISQAKGLRDLSMGFPLSPLTLLGRQGRLIDKGGK